ncbi:MAG TPA: kelch repeat-containing protein, partial [Thermoplasmata archaeon]|nr:kelch repeat-containing protein [Thermoplasmata archaeon]
MRAVTGREGVSRYSILVVLFVAMTVAPAAAFPQLPPGSVAAVVADPVLVPVAQAGHSSVAVPEWFEMLPAVAPQGRSTGAFAYDADSDRAVLFGGRYPGSQTLDYTWAYDYRANAWQNMSPALRPSGRE